MSSWKPSPPVVERVAVTDQARERPVLPGGRAFVVMLRADCDPARQDLRGRIEHVRSGRTAYFGSVAELVAFVAQITNGDGAEA